VSFFNPGQQLIDSIKEAEAKARHARNEAARIEAERRRKIEEAHRRMVEANERRR